jgi:thiamine biosynthesis lipoprotein
MRLVSGRMLTVASMLLVASASTRADPTPQIHMQRYCMGTMFDIVVYHSPRADGEAAVERAMAEILRLDQVMSDYKADSDLSRLNREGSRGFMPIEPSLYEVIQQSLTVSKQSGGVFDVTIAPLLKAWKHARVEGRPPTDPELAAARRCVGYEKVETREPDQIRFRNACVEIDLGGIGKGYAVDRALALLKAAGIRSALVNGGGSSIGAVGTPPGAEGWPVRVGDGATGPTTLVLRDRALSTSQQNLVPFEFVPGTFGEILDPHTAAPAQATAAVTVVADSASVADALSTTLVILPRAQADGVLARFGNVSALWMSPAGEMSEGYRLSAIRLSNAH